MDNNVEIFVENSLISQYLKKYKSENKQEEKSHSILLI